MEQTISSFANLAPIFAIILGAIGLLVALVIYMFIARQPAGNALMIELSDAIHDGAMVFLRKEYQLLGIFIAVVFLLLLVFY